MTGQSSKPASKEIRDSNRLHTRMASSPSFGVPQSKHDVFLSFRGEDTRCTFTSHLYAALCRKNINTFIDDEEIKKGDKLSPTLLAAIERSKISITIFSENYASSTWCLDELEKIIECKETKEHVVIPVFYHIDASHVRHQRGTYEDAFVKHEEHFRDNLNKVQKWRTALREAANSVGWDSSNIRLESELVERIVGDVLQKLNHMYPLVPHGLVGIEGQIARVESLLHTRSNDVRIVGIWGMGGIGKTTIADALCAKLVSQYEGCYFVANVREEWKNHRENDLRNKLLTGIFGDQNLSFNTPNMSSPFVIDRLQRKKLLIVLDDVSDSKQIEYLVREKDWFGPGSRIIVTTRNKDVFSRGVDGVYQVMELNFHEALKLFSLNAFRKDHPMREYIHLSERVLGHAKGIPLALKVLGSFLYSKRPKEWESTLEKLKKIPKAEIYNVLRLSYEGLDLEEQNIFLDIACCFKGETKCRVTSLLDGCGFSTDIGIRSLQDKSLITVSKDHKVQMHDSIQEMGWQIVREESMKEPGKRSRLWDAKEIYDVLRYNKGTDTVESIVLDMSRIKSVTISPQTFSRMYKLRLLNLYLPPCDKRSNVHISRGLESMPDELCYLRWDCFPLKSLPQSFCAEKLVELDLKHSLIEKLWDGMQDLGNLKSLYPSGCKHLIELPDFSMASKLEEVHLDNCTSLLNVPSTILSLHSLFALNLRGCKQLGYIQSDTQSGSLRWLNLSGCSRLEEFSVSSEKLECLILDGTTIKQLPSSVGQLKTLSNMYLARCKRLQNLPNTFYEIGLDCSIQFLDCPKLEKLPPILDTSASITTLCLDSCSNLSQLPDNLGLLSALNKLSLRGSNIEALPASIKNLSRLRALNVSNCKRLQSLPELPFLLQDLNASDCVSLETVSSSVKLLRNSFGWQNKISLLRQIQEEEKMSVRHRDYLGRFDFYNCKKLDQNASKIVMEEAIIRIQQAAYLSSMIKASHDPYYQPDEDYKNSGPENFVYISRQVYIILPGNEVPNWFTHKRTDSSTITVNLSGQWPCYCNYVGSAFCLVLGPSNSNKKKNHPSGLLAGCRYYLDDKYAGTCIIKSSHNDAESDQVWLWYDKLFKAKEETGNEYPITSFGVVSFEFFVWPHSSGLVLKQCGIRALYAPDDIWLSSIEQESKRTYIEYEGYESRFDYWSCRRYAPPHDSLGLLSERQRLSEHCDRHPGKSFPMISCAENLVDLTIEHSRLSNGAHVLVWFLYHPQFDESMLPAIRYLAQLLLDDYCNLGKLRDSINLLSSLKVLSLEGCNVESLPANIKHLSRLHSLSLYKCKRVRSLPELPPSLQILRVVNCTSLEIDELVNGNKRKLDGNSLKVMAEKKLVYEQVSTIEVIYPGSRVPEWFVYRTTGASLTIRTLNSEPWGLIFCFIIALPPSFRGPIICKCYLETSHGERVRIGSDCYLETSHSFALNGEKSILDHVCIWYSKSRCYEINKKFEERGANNLAVSFELLQPKDCFIKECGVCPVGDLGICSWNPKLKLDSEAQTTVEYSFKAK